MDCRSRRNICSRSTSGAPEFAPELPGLDRNEIRRWYNDEGVHDRIRRQCLLVPQVPTPLAAIIGQDVARLNREAVADEPREIIVVQNRNSSVQTMLGFLVKHQRLEGLHQLAIRLAANGELPLLEKQTAIAGRQDGAGICMRDLRCGIQTGSGEVTTVPFNEMRTRHPAKCPRQASHRKHSNSR